MQIIEVNVEDLIPYANNPRHNEEAVDKVAASIREFGFKVPIIIDKDNVIVAGHTRLKASKKLGLKTVPCIMADDLTEDQIKAFRLADNKTAEFAEWDFEKLIVELNDINGLSMTDFGFDDIDLDYGEYTPTGDDDSEEDDEFDDIERLERHYGVPYQGNKSRIADIIVSLLPQGDRLVDLFGGGGAITHCALLSNKWNRYLYNDINPAITGLFMDAVHGKYHDERRVITRDEFNQLKDEEAFIKYIWSFGNNGLAYLWGKDIEEIKQTACHALLDETIHERRLAYKRFLKMISNDMLRPRRLDLQSLEALDVLQRLEALEHIDVLQRLEVTNISYKDFEYQDGDVVYCDVPYEQAGRQKCDDYGVDFDSHEFYEWAKSRDYQVYFSSYEISDDSFDRVKVKSVASLIGANTNGKFVNEYLYSNRSIRGE